MLDVGRTNQGVAARGGTARRAVALARLAPFLPVATYLILSPLQGSAFRLELVVALGAAALAAAAAIHFLLRRELRGCEAAIDLLEGRLEIVRPAGKPPSDAERLAFAGGLAVDRIDTLTARIEKSALADELTGLPNRRAVLPQIKSALSRARRSGEPFAIALVDLDGLKHVNEVLGEEFGDAVLRDFGELLRAELRASDVAARWGGEEFLLLLPATTVDAAVGVVDRLRLRLLERPIAVVDGEAVTISSGVAGFRITDLHIEEIVKRADEALEQAKRAGRNRVMGLDAERFHEI